MQLCQVDPRPQDARIAAALEVDIAAVTRWREARSVEPEQACGMSEARLARSFGKGQEEVAATYADDARLFNDGYYRIDDGSIPPAGKAAALAMREPLVERNAKIGGIAPGSWTALGPERLGGRIRGLLFDAVDASRLYVGSASGGIWISGDSGTSWAPVNDFSASLSISSFAQAAGNPATIYAATGEISTGFRGAGLLKSTDRGISWQAIDATSPTTNFHWTQVQSVAMDPRNENHLIAGTACGFYRSVDAGSSWVSAYSFTSNGFCANGYDVVFSPSDPLLIIAGMTGRGIARSTDGGATFTRIQLGTFPSANWQGVVRVAVSASQPTVWFASVNENSGDIYRSGDSGATWTLLSNPMHLGNQGDYGNTIWVDPTTTNVLVVGGIDLHRSNDGGATWTKISNWVGGYRSGGTDEVSAHADHHAIVAAPGYNGRTNRSVFFGTDGGIYRNEDILSAANYTGWSSLNTGLITTQFYAASAKVYPAGLAVAGGQQDNSAQFLAAGAKSWQQPTTGDGGPAFFDPSDPTRLTMSTQYLALYRYNLTTGLLERICQNIPEAGTFCNPANLRAANFIAPYALDPTDSERMLAGAASLWRTTNARSGSPPAWSAVKAPSPTSTTNYINAVAQRADRPQVVFVGHNNGEIYGTDEAYAPIPTWTRLDTSDMPQRRVNRIIIDPARPAKLFALYAGFTSENVWISDDSGATWRSLASNLPAVPVFSLAIRPSDGNTLYAATDVGLFVSTNGGTTWSTTNDGPGGASVRDVAFADPTTIVVATYGRGAWKSTLTAVDSTFTLTVTRSGTGSGLVVSSPAIFNCGTTCGAPFNAGATVSLMAAASTGSYFAGWAGACTGTGPCTVTMDAAKAVTATFTLVTSATRLSNLSTRGQVQTGDNRMIGGFIIGGSAPKKVLVSARGPSLTAFGVVGAMANPSLQLLSGQTVIASNDDWGSAVNAADVQATGRAPTDALESAILTTLNPGAYTAIVSGVNDGTGVGIVEVFEIDRPDIPLTNLSTRGQVQTGDNVMIGGFVIQGTEPKTVLIRANGPSLTAFGVQGALANPSLRLNSGQTVIASNDDWQSASNAAAIQATGLAPTNPFESAILMTLNPGAYTAIVSGVNGGTGVGIVEVFAR